MKFIVKTLLLFFCARCCSGYDSFKEEESNESFLMNLVWKCTKTENLGNCLKLKAIKFLDKLVYMKEPLVITNYLSLAKDPQSTNMEYQEFNKSKTNLEPKLFRTEEDESKNLDSIIWNKLFSLLTTRTIQLSLSSGMFKGRGKEDKILKKGHGVFLMAAMMGGMMMKMALGKIALIAGKALIIGKIALILSLIIILKKFASHGGGGGGGGHPEIVYTSSEHGSGRTLGNDSDWREDGADLAYSAYHPKVTKTFN